MHCMNEKNDKEKGKEERKMYAPTLMSLDVNVLIVYFICCFLTFLSLRENNECMHLLSPKCKPLLQWISFHPIQRLFFYIYTIYFFHRRLSISNSIFWISNFSIWNNWNFWMLVNETLKNPGNSNSARIRPYHLRTEDWGNEEHCSLIQEPRRRKNKYKCQPLPAVTSLLVLLLSISLFAAFALSFIHFTSFIHCTPELTYLLTYFLLPFPFPCRSLLSCNAPTTSTLFHVERSTTRLHAPPGGKSSFSLVHDEGQAVLKKVTAPTSAAACDDNIPATSISKRIRIMQPPGGVSSFTLG